MSSSRGSPAVTIHHHRHQNGSNPDMPTGCAPLTYRTVVTLSSDQDRDYLFQHSSHSMEYRAQPPGKPLQNGSHTPRKMDSQNGNVVAFTNPDSDMNGDIPHFHMSEHKGLNGQGDVTDESDHYPMFVFRDVKKPETAKDRKIISCKGTVRGVRNRVKSAIEGFSLPPNTEGEPVKNYRILEQGKIVIYTTSMMIVRETHEKCKTIKKILQTHMVKYEERDIFMSRQHQRDLKERLGSEDIDVPQVFADGQHFGGAEEIEKLNEIGELRKILKPFKKVSTTTSCEKCGGYRYVPCTSCNGSKKSLHRNSFTEEFISLRCVVCDENGLLDCDLCQNYHNMS